MISNAQEQEVTLEFENALSASEIAQNYVQNLKDGNLSDMDKLLHQDAMIYGLGGGLDSLNVAQHKEYYSTALAAYKYKVERDLYLPVKVTNNWNEGEWVLTWGTNYITDKQTGKLSTVPYHIAFLVAEGKITGIFYYYDSLNVIKSLGYSVTPPAE